MQTKRRILIMLVLSVLLVLFLAGCECKEGEHDYQSEITKEATCTETGIEVFTCKICKKKHTDEIPMLEHEYQASISKEATCGENGEKLFVYYSECAVG